MKSRLSAAIVSCLVLAGAATFAPAGDNEWTSTGPYGGVFSWFSFHPQKKNLVFAGGWMYGIFRSRDGGTTWQRLEVQDNIFALRIHPRNPDRLIAVTTSVYASSDEGSTWERIAVAPQGLGEFQDMEFHPADPQTLYAVLRADQQTSGVYKSKDGGRTWTSKSAGIEFNCAEPFCGSVPQLEIDPTNGNVVYALVPSLKVFKTTDGGESWVSASDGLALTSSTVSLAIDSKDPRILYASSSREVFKTMDGGAHWTACSLKGGGALSVDAQHPQNVYVAGGRLWKSRDGGQTWADLSPDEYGFRGVAVHPRLSKVVFAGADGEGVYLSRNAGKEWALVNDGLDAQDVRQLHRDPKNPDHLLAVTGSLMETLDGGVIWTNSPPSNGTEWAGVLSVQIHPKNSQLVVAGVASDSGGLAVSRDNGSRWEFRGSYTQVTGVGLDWSDQNILYFAPLEHYGGKALGIAKSTDQGKTSRLINAGLTDKEVISIVVDSKNSRTIFAGTRNGKVFKSTNGGTSWKKSSLGSSAGRVSCITIDPADSRIVYAGTWNGTFKSADGGATWTHLNPLGDFFVEIDRTNSRNLYTGGTGGMFISTDRGATWSAFPSAGLGPGPFKIWDFVSDPKDPDHFRIGTERGVFSYTRKGDPGGPVIVQISPGSGKAGDAITINGSGFGSVQSTSKVLFESVDAGTAQSWSDASIAITVPAAAATGAVTVTVLDKQSNPFDEFVVLPPSGNIWPTSGPAAGGTRVTILAPHGISGSAFQVYFGLVLAGNVAFQAPDIVTCDAPLGTGTVDVKITTVLTSSTRGTYTYQ